MCSSVESDTPTEAGIDEEQKSCGRRRQRIDARAEEEHQPERRQNENPHQRTLQARRDP